MWNLKDNTNGLTYKIETDSHIQKTNLWLQKGKGRGINWEYGIKRCTLLYTKQINNDLLYSTGNYIQCLVTNYNEKIEKRICTYINKNIYV